MLTIDKYVVFLAGATRSRMPVLAKFHSGG